MQFEIAPRAQAVSRLTFRSFLRLLSAPAGQSWSGQKLVWSAKKEESESKKA
jgi:hypothetical protein